MAVRYVELKCTKFTKKRNRVFDSCVFLAPYAMMFLYWQKGEAQGKGNSVNTEVKNAVIVTDKEAQYDENAKRLLGNKHILAHILARTVDEFKGMNPEEVVSYIEGEPMIGIVPVEPGLTNVAREEQGQRVVGFNTENVETHEGLVRFDIVFYVRMKDGISQIIVNIEVQKDVPTKYKILNRAIFYVSRLVSSQKERDFTKTNYDDIKRVFSIWICMGMDENSLDYVHLADDKLLGDYVWEGKMDLLNIVLIGVSEEMPEQDECYELHRLLGALLSAKLPIEEKLDILETEYGIPMEDEEKEEVDVMSNLGEGIREKAEARGEAKGEAKVILSMYRKGYTLEQIADVAEKSVEEVRGIVEKREPALA